MFLAPYAVSSYLDSYCLCTIKALLSAPTMNVFKVLQSRWLACPEHSPLLRRNTALQQQFPSFSNRASAHMLAVRAISDGELISSSQTRRHGQAELHSDNLESAAAALPLPQYCSGCGIKLQATDPTLPGCVRYQLCPLSCSLDTLPQGRFMWDYQG